MGGFAARVLLRSTRFGAFGAKTENLTTPPIVAQKSAKKGGYPPHSRQPDFPEINLVPISNWTIQSLSLGVTDIPGS